MRLIIQSEVPSQKNGKQISFNKTTGRRFIRSNDRVVVWKEKAITELRVQFKGYRITGYPIALNIVFYYGTHRRKDLDNSAAGVMDALVAAGVIEDDSVQFISCLTLQFGGYDKENPRVEIDIED